MPAPSAPSCRRAPSRRLAALVAALAVLGAGVAVAPAAAAAPATPAFGAAIDRLAPYQGQTSCDPTEKPGVVGFLALVQAAYPRVNSGGVVRGCDVGGSSEHKEGRAWDWMLRADVPADRAAADDLLGWLLATDEHGNAFANARRLGVMYVIWDRQWWSSWAADRGWQPYTGASPHTDHVHLSFSWDGALQRTSWWTGGVPTTGPVPSPGGPGPAPLPTGAPPQGPAPAALTQDPGTAPAARPAAGPLPRSADDACPAGRVPSASFGDTAVSPHAAAVDCAVWWEVARGTSPTTFAPEATLTRAQAASFLARTLSAAGVLLPTAPPDAFDDDDGSVHERAIDQMAALGVVAGTGGRTYAPDEPVTRAQTASQLVRAAEQRTAAPLPAGEDWFTDDDGSVHKTAIGKAAAAGLTGGTTATTFSPAVLTTRGQTASFLTRLLDLLVEGGWVPGRGA